MLAGGVSLNGSSPITCCLLRAGCPYPAPPFNAPGSQPQTLSCQTLPIISLRAAGSRGDGCSKLALTRLSPACPALGKCNLMRVRRQDWGSQGPQEEGEWLSLGDGR